MKNERTVPTLVGVLYIIGTTAGVASAVVAQGISGAPDAIAAVAANTGPAVVTGSLILVMAVALAVIPALMFPILKRESEVLAVGYVIFRGGLEVLLTIAAALSWLVLPVVARLAADTAGAGASQYSALGTLALKALAPIAGVTSIVFVIGGVMLYYAMLRLRLVPRWLSGWGLAGCAPYMVAGVIGLFGAAPGLLFVPLALQEMVMAVWLIVKGFGPSAARRERGLQPVAA